MDSRTKHLTLNYGGAPGSRSRLSHKSGWRRESVALFKRLYGVEQEVLRLSHDAASPAAPGGGANKVWWLLGWKCEPRPHSRMCTGSTFGDAWRWSEQGPLRAGWRWSAWCPGCPALSSTMRTAQGTGLASSLTRGTSARARLLPHASSRRSQHLRTCDRLSPRIVRPHT